YAWSRVTSMSHNEDCKSMLGLMGVKEEETSLPTGENSDSSSSEAESEDEVDSEYYLVRAIIQCARKLIGNYKTKEELVKY
ncbi:hypothetical protein J6590_085532, partial [Homalodisca vitripennis]